MLTKEDLNAIDGIVRKRVAEGIAPLEKRITRLEIAVRKLQKNLDTVIRFFDKETTNLRRRIERIEEKLGLSPLVS